MQELFLWALNLQKFLVITAQVLTMSYLQWELQNFLHHWSIRFSKRSNFLKCSSRAVKQLSINSEILANSENLDAHSISARLRRNLKW